MSPHVADRPVRTSLLLLSKSKNPATAVTVAVAVTLEMKRQLRRTESVTGHPSGEEDV
jgi:hypothetical protein